VVGATVGFSLVLRGDQGIKWMKILTIVVSWIASPLIAGIFSVFFYFICKHVVFNKKNQLEASLKLMPFAFFFVVAINGFSVFYDGSKFLGFDKIPWWGDIILSLGLGAIAAAGVQVFAVNRIRKLVLNSNGVAGHGSMVNEKKRDSLTRNYSTISSVSGSISVTASTEILATTDEATTTFRSCCSRGVTVVEHEDTFKVFSALQILSACFLSFSHGTNGTSNAIGPLAGAWLVYNHGYAKAKAPDYELELLIAYGVVALLVGLWCLGHKVISTVAKDISNEITPCSGFCMQLGTAFTLLIASKIGTPVSMTHALVGTVVLVGWYRAGSADVSWRTFRGIALAWIVTLPVAGLLAAFLTWLLNFALVNM